MGHPAVEESREPQLAVFNTGKGLPHQFETDELYKPLFNVFMEVIVDPKIVADWPFPGWDGGDIGHTWLIQARKQEKPCR